MTDFERYLEALRRDYQAMQYMNSSDGDSYQDYCRGVADGLAFALDLPAGEFYGPPGASLPTNTHDAPAVAFQKACGLTRRQSDAPKGYYGEVGSKRGTG